MRNAALLCQTPARPCPPASSPSICTSEGPAGRPCTSTPSSTTPALAAALPDAEHHGVGESRTPLGMLRGPAQGRNGGLTWWPSNRP